MATEAMATLLGATLAASGSILLVLALRVPLRLHLDAGAAHGLWACVPLACLAILLPAREAGMPWALPLAVVLQPTSDADASSATAFRFASLHGWMLLGWGIGVAGMATRLVLQQFRFVRGLGPVSEAAPGLLTATACHGLPAAFGVLRPKVVVPADFHVRYTDEERALVLCHERIHIRRGDLAANLLASLLRCLFWFNPLVHFAARLHRLDQEFACDARVIACHPGARRRYGEAMLKAQLAGSTLPVGCHWSSQHPLKERIAMLGKPLPTRRHKAVAALLVIMAITATACGAWSMQPASDTYHGIAGTVAASGSASARAEAANTTRQPAPSYPSAALESRQSGQVMLRLKVGPDGRVRDATIEESVPEGLFDEASLEAARQWTFDPPLENGVPVEGWVRVPIRFDINDDGDGKDGGGDSLHRVVQAR